MNPFKFKLLFFNVILNILLYLNNVELSNAQLNQVYSQPNQIQQLPNNNQHERGGEINAVLSHLLQRNANNKKSNVELVTECTDPVSTQHDNKTLGSLNTLSMNNQSQMHSEFADEKTVQLQKLIQEIYLAQAQVQLEVAEIQRAQTIAAAAQKQLEETANDVRVITSALHVAQESVANAALRAQTAQLQLAAHDQLLFTARQKVDALSAQMVALQAEVGITGDKKMTFNLAALMDKLKKPLDLSETPKSIPILIDKTSTSITDNQSKIKINSAIAADGEGLLNPQQDQNKISTILKKRSDNPSDNNQELSISDDDDIVDFLNWIRIIDTNDPKFQNSLLTIENDHLRNEFMDKLKNVNNALKNEQISIDRKRDQLISDADEMAEKYVKNM